MKKVKVCINQLHTRIKFDTFFSFRESNYIYLKKRKKTIIKPLTKKNLNFGRLPKNVSLSGSINQSDSYKMLFC